MSALTCCIPLAMQRPSPETVDGSGCPLTFKRTGNMTRNMALPTMPLSIVSETSWGDLWVGWNG